MEPTSQQLFGILKTFEEVLVSKGVRTVVLERRKLEPTQFST